MPVSLCRSPSIFAQERETKKETDSLMMGMDNPSTDISVDSTVRSSARTVPDRDEIDRPRPCISECRMNW
jgi:hypothetical protein